MGNQIGRLTWCCTGDAPDLLKGDSKCDAGEAEAPATLVSTEVRQSRKSSKQENSNRDSLIDHGRFIVDKVGDPGSAYLIDKKKLGEGAYGSVTKATQKASGTVRAMKTIFKKKMKEIWRFKQEISIMKMMDHPNIIKLYETFEDNHNIYLIMELCTGGELFDRIIDCGNFTETQAAIIMQQIVRAIYYMHQNRIAHRDLKPENFLCHNKDKIEKTVLKIIDFGLSCHIKSGQVLATKAGTPYYIAPQVLRGKYTEMSDLWSCGVIMYVLICGYPPFYAETDNEVLKLVKKGKFSFDDNEWRNVSDDAKNLIVNLLKMEESERFTAEQALNDVWIRDFAPKSANVPLQSHIVDNLRRFRGQNKLQKAALHIIASQLKEDEIAGLREIFVSLDGNGDGSLTCEEMKEGIQRAGLKNIPEELQIIMEEVDSDGSGVIDYTEFLAATLDRRLHVQEDVCWSAFRVFDRNGDGQISQAELKIVLANDQVNDVLGAEGVKKLLGEIDTDGDGQISFSEFMEMMQGGQPDDSKSIASNSKGAAFSSKSRSVNLHRTCTFANGEEEDTIKNPHARGKATNAILPSNI